MKILILAAVLSTALAQRDNPSHTLDCDAFDGVTELPEGDKILITEEPDDCQRISNGQNMEIAFELSASLIQVRRWKAVVLHRFDNNSDQKKVLQQQCGFELGCSTQSRFNFTDIINYGSVVLWKDELWPLRPYAAYRIGDTASCFKPGNLYKIDWLDDGWIPGWLPTLAPFENDAGVEEAQEDVVDELYQDFLLEQSEQQT